jgi:hypothetical protein
MASDFIQRLVLGWQSLNALIPSVEASTLPRFSFMVGFLCLVYSAAFVNL